ncbi:MAG: hypothetical protein O7G85_05130 [Planctomycetota bacterium]|nr:hypothetical protein [Planctomycetota bacterium]
MRYPNEYVWLVFVSCLDLTLTWVILEGLEGDEINPLAKMILESLKGTPSNPFDNSILSLMGYLGLIVFKFCLILFVMLVCEVVGRRNNVMARRLARFGVVVSAIPVLVSLYLLITEVLHL